MLPLLGGECASLFSRESLRWPCPGPRVPYGAMVGGHSGSQSEEWSQVVESTACLGKMV